MIVGAALVEIHVHGSRSLKQKRGVVRSIVQRVRNRFNVSIAEVDGQGTWQRAVLGLSSRGHSLRSLAYLRASQGAEEESGGRTTSAWRGRTPNGDRGMRMGILYQADGTLRWLEETYSAESGVQHARTPNKGP